MQVNNFEFLKDKLPILTTLGSFAEQYVYADPQSSGVKLRIFGEEVTKILYQQLNIPLPDDKSFFGLLDYDGFVRFIPKVIIGKLHRIRKSGNRAAHSDLFTSKDAIELLKEAYDISRWLYLSVFNGEITECGEFQYPAEAPKTAEWQKERQELLQQLYKREQQVEKLLGQLEEARNIAQIEQKTQEELHKIHKRGNQVANVLQFDEATTRRLLIDDQLVVAGWNIGAEGQNTSEVTQEEEIKHQPTETGIGFADYVLWDDDGKPLAVIEAKRTSKDPNLGKKQAVIYADGLQKEYGQRPVIFYTNGYDIYIWNDAAKEPPRKIYGFYSKDSLQYLLFQRRNKLSINQIKPNLSIIDRAYQLEAVRRVLEDFNQKKRKALIVQATGTGKTRVAIALVDALIKARWAKRVLFLCDRRELRKQAKNVFNEYTNEPLTVVSANTYKERDKRIYLATYPAMLKIYQTFDVGFFDLIIADESHRSIYNVYKEIFLYFDALQVGLTATPVDFIHRNTFSLFGRPDGDPTTSFSYEDAINSEPPYLVPFEVFTHTTQFLRDGIKYTELSHEQQLELEEQLAEAEELEVEAGQIDRQVFNKDTNREILRNLMENGIKDKTGMHPGKTIIFARSHKHAMLLRELFDEMYPQYGGKFCAVIDNYNPRAEQLIDDFKGFGNNDELTIAISVDMLDTGIDVPEVVNLVFAKPVKSFVKFWQMIGRGTRLCPNLFGPGKDKEKFRIFDHWRNFEWFDVHYKKAETTTSKSLMQRLFEMYVRLADTALQKFDKHTFSLAVDLMHQELNTLQSIKTVAVKEKWKTIAGVNQETVLKQFSAETKQVLLSEIAPLMSWRNIRGQYAAYDFDLLIAILQIELLSQTSLFRDYKDILINRLNRLQPNLSPVQAKMDVIKKVLASEFWQKVTVIELENIRQELRGIMRFQQRKMVENTSLTIDVTENEDLIEHDVYMPKRLEGLDLLAYKQRVEKVLQELFDNNETLKKIKAGEPVNEDDLESLVSLVLMQHPDIDLNILQEIYPETAGHLDYAIRRIIGLDGRFVSDQFQKFIQRHPELTAKQMRFLDMLKNHISKYGAIKPERLYDSPFTLISGDGPEGIFKDKQVDELIGLVKEISEPYTADEEKDK
ncbi:MAG TPA: DEAD/DEAH box helicase [Caldithrix abyssi]|uniref:DEAD/DEAH box helicase n=1 Tax=Caldithrix abyssi TaxID=187145 RepID=A0A7V4WTV3_CALAY|nr:DEAD/DEAH box helicase [Caldithrix abyssi]